MKRLLKLFWVVFIALIVATGCENALEITLPQGPKGDKGDKGEPGLSAFDLWKEYYGKDPDTSIIEFFNSMKGKDGSDGAVPVIGENGNWVIDGVDTGIPARGKDGKDGKDGVTPIIGENGNWIIDGIDTGIPARGKDGKDGSTPEIGPNGNWYINGFDTGIKARGEDGSIGLTPHIGANGNWYIGAYDTGVPATGPQGPQGSDGVDGKTAYDLWKEAVDTGSMKNKDGSPYTGTSTWESFLIWLQGGDVSVLYKYWLSKGNTGDMDTFLSALFDCHCDGITVTVNHPVACITLDQLGNVTGLYPATIKLGGVSGTQFVLMDGNTIIDQGIIPAGLQDITFYVNRETSRNINILINATIPGKTEQVTKTAQVKKLAYNEFTVNVVQSAISEEDVVTLSFTTSPAEIKVGTTVIYTTASGITSPGWNVDVDKKIFTKTYNRSAAPQVFAVEAKGTANECTRSAFTITQLTPVIISTPPSVSLIPGNSCDLLITLRGTAGMTVTASYPHPNTSVTQTVTLVESLADPGLYELLGIPRTYLPYTVTVTASKSGAGTVIQTLPVNGVLLMSPSAPVTFTNNNGPASNYAYAKVINQFKNETTSSITINFTNRTGGTSGATKRGTYPFSITIAPGVTEDVEFFRDYTNNYATGSYTVNYVVVDGCGRTRTANFQINNQSEYRVKFTKPSNWGGAGQPGGPGEPGWPNSTPINPGDPMDVDITIQVELFDAMPGKYFQFLLFTGVGHNTVLAGQTNSNGYFSEMRVIKASALDKALRNGVAKFNFFNDSAYTQPIDIGTKSNVPFTF